MALQFDPVSPACRELLQVKKLKINCFTGREKSVCFLVFIYLPLENLSVQYGRYNMNRVSSFLD